MGPNSDGPTVSSDILDDIRSYLVRSRRFEQVECEPAHSPTSLRCYFDTGYYPTALEEVYLDIVWFTNSDFTIHYHEWYSDGETWECRWDRHPNSHNNREHFHSGPDATRANAVDASYPTDWRDVLERVLTETDERMRGFW